MTCNIITPGKNPVKKINIFLAGSIDNGFAEDWQEKVITKLTDLFGEFDDIELNIHNPRSENWDKSIDPSVSSEALVDQIRWELQSLESSDLVLMYFGEDSKSPISLLELGLHKDKNIFVFCPDNFYRSVNVNITGEYYGFPVYSNEDEWVADISSNICYLASIMP